MSISVRVLRKPIFPKEKFSFSLPVLIPTRPFLVYNISMMNIRWWNIEGWYIINISFDSFSIFALATNHGWPYPRGTQNFLSIDGHIPYVTSKVEVSWGESGEVSFVNYRWIYIEYEPKQGFFLYGEKWPCTPFPVVLYH